MWGPAGRASITVKWTHAALANARFFTMTPEALQATRPEEIRVRVQSPIGVPIRDFTYQLALDQRRVLQIFFNPPLRTHRSLVVTVDAPPNVIWTNQLRVPHSAVRPHIDDPVQAAMLLPPRLERPLFFAGCTGLLFATLLGLSVHRRPDLLVPLFFVISGTLLVWSARSVEARLWFWWGECWPDGYVRCGAALARWLQGSITYAETGITAYRNGQVWLVPMILAVLASAGMRMSDAFFLLNALSVLLALGLVARYLWNSTRNPAVVAFFLILAGSAVAVVRVGVGLTTDSAALGALAVFLVLFLSLLKKPDSPRLLVGVTLAAVACCQIRIALFPLMVLPPAIGLYIVVEAMLRGTMERAVLQRALLIAAPGLVASLLVPAICHMLGVMETFDQARAFSQSEQFRSQFRWDVFAMKTAVAMFPLVLVAVLAAGERKRFSLRRLPLETVAVAVCAFGLVALLAAGRIIPWHRYWAPVAFCSALLAALCSERLQANRALAAATVGMLAQIAFFVHYGVEV